MTGPAVDVEQLQRLLERATPGPWEAQDYDDQPGDEGTCVLAGKGRDARAVAYAILYPWTTPESCDADAQLIAAAVTQLPALLDFIRRQDAALTAVRELHVPERESTDDVDWCAACTTTWPCSTAAALASPNTTQEGQL